MGGRCGILSGFLHAWDAQTQGGAATPLTLGYVVEPLRGYAGNGRALSILTRRADGLAWI